MRAKKKFCGKKMGGFRSDDSRHLPTKFLPKWNKKQDQNHLQFKIYLFRCSSHLQGAWSPNKITHHQHFQKNSKLPQVFQNWNISKINYLTKLPTKLPRTCNKKWVRIYIPKENSGILFQYFWKQQYKRRKIRKSSPF